MTKSWKTTLLGVLALLGAVAAAGTAVFDADPNTVPNVNELLAAFTGLGLMYARDNNVSSEQAGAK